ncbi:MAG: GerAB/ArcD/ProY family transporter [Clostridia bacterium]|nr:GerAB/ArcD/ProY family transporter [Clostridia bacterium]
MNLREGRVGRQESIAAAAIMLTVSGLFASGSPKDGNSAWLYLPLSLLLGTMVFLFVSAAMKRSGARDFAELNGFALGTAAPLFGTLLSLALCGACALVLDHFVTLLHKYVFVGAAYPTLVLFCILPPLFMTWKGLECISRTAKLFAWVLAVSLLLELVLAAGAYESYRLFPLLGEGLPALAKSSGRGIGLFLPAFAALFICAEGLQGQQNARKYGIRAAATAGILLIFVSAAIALVFPYHDAEEVFSPLYRMSSLGRDSKYQLRLDKVLLFLWLAGGMIAVSAYNYAAALQFAKSFDQQDIRPAAGVFPLLSAGAVLLRQSEGANFDLMAAISRYASAVLLVLLLFPAVIALYRCGRRARA